MEPISTVLPIDVKANSYGASLKLSITHLMELFYCLIQLKQQSDLALISINQIKVKVSNNTSTTTTTTTASVSPLNKLVVEGDDGAGDTSANNTTAGTVC
jgi:hypothetical protein